MDATAAAYPRTVQRVVRLFRDQLGYDYLGNLTEREDNRSIEDGRKHFDVIDH
jgi:type I restriction enzyme R subunit